MDEVRKEEIRNMHMATIRYGIEWANRDMVVDVSENDAENAKKIIDEAYSRWCNVDENPDLQFECCEEYILSQLTDNGIHFIDRGSIDCED